MSHNERLRQLSSNLEQVRARVSAAAESCDRLASEVSLIVVTKNWPASDVHLLSALGVHDVGENRDQEAASKHADCVDLALRWHFVGGLQRNKCRSVARYADVVQSVDRLELVPALARAAENAERHLDLCLQVSLDGAAGREGAAPNELPRLAEAVLDEPALDLIGLMAVAPLQTDPQAAFARLGEIWADFQIRYPSVRMLSAGMSEDLEAAIRNGATHVRVGTAVLGHRPDLR